MIDDIYVLLKLLEEMSLKAHNNAENSTNEDEKKIYTQEKDTCNKIIRYIKTMGKRSG